MRDLQRVQADPAPGPTIDYLLTISRRVWPEDMGIERRVRELAANWGHHWAALAIEKAELKRAVGIEYAFAACLRWHNSGDDIEDIEAEVQGDRHKPKRAKSAEETMQNFNPRTATTDQGPPTPEDVRMCLDDIRTATNPVLKQFLLGGLKGWINQGFCSPSLLDEFEPVAGKTPTAGPHANDRPPPARCPTPDVTNSTVNASPRENWKRADAAQRARQESNLQPSDSKSANLRVETGNGGLP